MSIIVLWRTPTHAPSVKRHGGLQERRDCLKATIRILTDAQHSQLATFTSYNRAHSQFQLNIMSLYIFLGMLYRTACIIAVYE